MESVASYKARGNVMRIGILTFHSEINYGSVLQAFALQTHLQNLGHDVVIIDKWEDVDNRRLLGPLCKRSILFWLGYLLRAVCFSSGFARIRRHIKTILLIRRYLNRTKYHFYKWDAAPRTLGVDLIIVGSDQVWNPSIVPPGDYLLKDIPGDIPGIAYAASIGQHSIDACWQEEYKQGFKRFRAIGVREMEAKKLVEAMGGRATHVVDPTLLVDPAICWSRFLSANRKTRPILFAYLMTPTIASMLPELLSFAIENDADVELYLDNQMLPFPLKGGRAIKEFIKMKVILANPRMHVRFSGAPNEFVQSVAKAKWVITESFHGLMFATIFRKNARVVLLNKNNEGRGLMSARLKELEGHIIAGPLISDSIKHALESIRSGETISYDEAALGQWIGFSRDWLKSNIDNVNAGIYADNK